MITPSERLQSDRLRYPALLVREIVVLRAWLVQHEHEYDFMDYNVRVGQGSDPGPTYTAEQRRAAVLVTQKRIDVMAWAGVRPEPADYLDPFEISNKLAGRGGSPTILEVKDRATAAAVTQILTYEALWTHAHPESAPPKMILVTNRLDPDIFIIAPKYNVRIDQVEADFSTITLR